MRIVFAGTPDFAAKHLQALIDKKFDVVAVYTQPDRPAGRGKKPQTSAVKQVANANNIRVFQPVNFKHQEQVDELAALNADIMVVVAYGIILPSSVLDTPTFGCLNVHGSLLPKWRGAAPIQRAIWAGDAQTGVTIMQMDEGLDTGPMLHKDAIDIEPQDTSFTMYEKLAELGPKALIWTIDNYSTLLAEAQINSHASYAKKLCKEEALVDWQLDAQQLERNCRAFNPWPTQWFKTNDKSIKVWKCHVQCLSEQHEPGTIIKADKTGLYIATGKDCLVLTELQLPGKKPMAIGDVLNGRADWFNVGSTL